MMLFPYAMGSTLTYRVTRMQPTALTVGDARSPIEPSGTRCHCIYRDTHPVVFGASLGHSEQRATRNA